MLGTNTKEAESVKSKISNLNFYQRIIDYVFRPMVLGRLTMCLPDGRQLIYGQGQGVEANIKILSNDFFRKCVLFGDVGFGESYVQGDWQTDDIVKVIEWMITNVENHPTLMADKKKPKPVNFFKIINDLYALARRNSIKQSKKNIQAHYDLGNEFYKLFLDETLTYSSAYFKDEAMSLAQAQEQKYQQLCQKIRLQKTDHVLEIGSGWGGFAIYMAKNYGCQVTTVTISQAQFNYAQERILKEKLQDRITILLKDYRALEGRFDKLVSVEMLEAVGHEYYQDYFKQCHRLLKKDGILALQVILCPDHRYHAFRKNTDWIQKYIFPGSLLPSMSVIQENIKRTGTLGLYDYEDVTRHYVKTLLIWNENFNNRLDDVLAQGFDDQFIRKWNYYLCYCAAAFKTRNIMVAQMIFSRPNNALLA